MERTAAIILDLDGTMWDSVDGILLTWNQVASKYPECRKKPISKDELSGCLGLTMTDIADRLFPGVAPGKQKAILEECCREENAYLAEYGGKLYPKLEETLLELKKTYKLFVVSNCQQGYIESFIKAHKLEKCFDDIECWGNNLLTKGENNKLIMERNHVARAVYVGDTRGDEKSARDAGIPFVFAAYGFGTAEAPDYVIDEFAKLPEIMKNMRSTA